MSLENYYWDHEGRCHGCIEADLFDPVLIKYEDHIKSFGYQTVSVNDIEYNPDLYWNVIYAHDLSLLYYRYNGAVTGLQPG